jgi:ferric iron reductase protein FhuF
MGLVPVTGERVAAAVRRAGAGNPLLGIDIGFSGGVGIDSDIDSGLGTDSGAGGLPAVGLSAGTGPAAALVDAVGAWLGSGERRVAASMVLLGYAARLVGPAVAVLLRDGILLDLRTERVRYSFAPDRGFRLTITEPAGFTGDPDALLRRWCADLIDEHLATVIGAVRRVVPVAAGLMWGNVASGLAGALRALAREGSVPPAQCHAAGLVLLACGPLAGSGQWTMTDTGPHFIRRSCCLFYRLDGGGMCGDCPLGVRR